MGEPSFPMPAASVAAIAPIARPAAPAALGSSGVAVPPPLGAGAGPGGAGNGEGAGPGGGGGAGPGGGEPAGGGVCAGGWSPHAKGPNIAAGKKTRTIRTRAMDRDLLKGAPGSSPPSIRQNGAARLVARATPPRRGLLGYPSAQLCY